MKTETLNRGSLHGAVRRICREPQINDRLRDDDGQLVVCYTRTTLEVVKLCMREGEQFTYDSADSPNAEVSEVAVADSTKTSGVRPPLSLD